MEGLRRGRLPVRRVVKLLLITGQRRREVSGMRWSELSDDFTVWSLPPQRTKNKRPHVVFLPPLAREIVASVPRIANAEHLFTTTGTTPISGFSKFKAQLDDAMETNEPWRVHDLRRTCVTGMAELGVQPHVIEAVVNHVSGHKGGVAGVYNRAAYAPEKKAALELWGRARRHPRREAAMSKLRERIVENMAAILGLIDNERGRRRRLSARDRRVHPEDRRAGDDVAVSSSQGLRPGGQGCAAVGAEP